VGSAHFSAHRETVTPRQADIENQKLRLLALHSLEHAVAPVFHADSETVRFEVGADELRQAKIVLDEHDEWRQHCIHRINTLIVGLLDRCGPSAVFSMTPNASSS
jgi:hypothetical protein